jgi:hypothetical protein
LQKVISLDVTVINTLLVVLVLARVADKKLESATHKVFSPNVYDNRLGGGFTNLCLFMTSSIERSKSTHAIFIPMRASVSAFSRKQL